MSRTARKPLVAIQSKGTAEPALSPRECVIVQLIAEGLRNREISDRLKLSVKTVESHRAVIMRKLSIKSVAPLVRYAIRNRLIEP
jgi:DNA-binding NarL/FixJ family response regulator